MKYLFSDFYFLCGAAEKGVCTVGGAYEHMTMHMLFPVAMPCLLHAVRGLASGGYITVSPEEGVISASTPLAVTDLGKKAVAISGLQKLLGESKAFHKNEQRFCAHDRPAVSEDHGWMADAESFDAITAHLMQAGDIFLPLFELTDEGNNRLTLTVHHPNHDPLPDGDDEGENDGFDPDAVERADSVSVTGPADTVMQGVSDLLAVAHALLTEAPRPRKVALHGADRSLLVSLARASSEYGTILRMTVSQIRFNRQRFIGKRDSDLDYAQCGDPLITLELADAEGFARSLLRSAVTDPARLDDAMLAHIDGLHSIL